MMRGRGSGPEPAFRRGLHVSLGAMHVRSALLISSVGCLLVLAQPAMAQELLVNGGFETPEVICGFPATPGDWGVDSFSIVGAEAGVSPRTGAGMVRMESTFFTGSGATCRASSGGAFADGAQLVDVTHCSPVDRGARLLLSAHFNAAVGAGTDQFRCTLRAFSSDLSSFPSAGAPIAEAQTLVTPDADPSSWQRCDVELDLPPTATYVAAYVSARSVSGSREIYADDVSLVPVMGRCGFDCVEPGAVCPYAGSDPLAVRCDAMTGLCVQCLLDADCDDGIECTEDRCTASACEGVPALAGDPCSGGVCDGSSSAASCVECLLDLHCAAGETCEAASSTCVGLPMDSGAPEDAGGALPDAGPRPAEDGGSAADSGPGPVDGSVDGSEPPPDGASARRDAGDAATPSMAATEGGCGCSVQAPSSGSAAWLWLAVPCMVLRRRIVAKRARSKRSNQVPAETRRSKA